MAITNKGAPRTPFIVDKKKGLRRRVSKSKTEYIAPYIELRGIATEENAGDAGYLVVIRYRDALTNKLKPLIQPREILLKPHDIKKALMNGGYDVPTSGTKLKLLLKYLRTTTTPHRYAIVGRTGWCDSGYIRADGEIIGDKSRIIYQPATPPRIVHPATGGTLDGWRDEVAKPALHSRLMIFTICMSLSALLLRLSGDESGVFHLFGESTAGKGLLELAAMSIHGWARRKDLLHWDATETGIDELAAEHCDRVLVLDETGHLAGTATTQDAAAKAQKVSFKIAAGTGRLRSAFFGKRGNLSQWRVLVLSSGEHAISEIATAAGRRRLKG
ncbi:MAG: DUF927 domain-containing protein, partial [Blastocatellia bacterium]